MHDLHPQTLAADTSLHTRCLLVLLLLLILLVLLLHLELTHKASRKRQDCGDLQQLLQQLPLLLPHQRLPQSECAGKQKGDKLALEQQEKQ